ncbi:P-loop NTPase [Spirochaetia bacterium 38H-sp]|uniref:Iron-sulfur cluster carrier protein n=1 Tax=Rarispira pelagica TaxID=3141764 RepID=A0ABU9UEB7_9SPIR
MSNVQKTKDAVLKALSSIMDPDLGKNIVELGFVKDLVIEESRVSFNLELTTPSCPIKEQFVEQSKKAILSSVQGIDEVDVKLTSRVRSDNRIADKLNVPVKTVLAVGSGKGGVGKSTVTVLLARLLAQDGAKVGVLDADIYGPNIPRLLPAKHMPAQAGEKIVPARTADGIVFMSVGFLVEENQALVWRGPMLHSMLNSLISQVDWPELDYLLIDMPPGTGDVQLSVSQLLPVTGGVLVATPHPLAQEDLVRGIDAFEKLSIPLIGIVENMAGDVFGQGTTAETAKRFDADFLGSIMMDAKLAAAGRSGDFSFLTENDEFKKLAQAVASKLSIKTAE